MIDPDNAGVWGWIALASSAFVMASLVWSDVRSGLIPNKLTYPAAVLGLVLHGIAADVWWRGLLDGFLGLALGFVVLFLGFMFGGIGGGDVKACGALGALVGLSTTALGLLYMGLVAGAMALSIMIWKGKLWRGLQNTFRFFLTALTPFMKTEMPKPENSDPFPLGVAIAVGFAWAIVEQGFLDAEPLIRLRLIG
jgi:prepilin peptidase CpaA